MGRDSSMKEGSTPQGIENFDIVHFFVPRLFQYSACRTYKFLKGVSNMLSRECVQCDSDTHHTQSRDMKRRH